MCKRTLIPFPSLANEFYLQFTSQSTACFITGSVQVIQVKCSLVLRKGACFSLDLLLLPVNGLQFLLILVISFGMFTTQVSF